MGFALVMLVVNVVFNLVVWPPFLRRIKPFLRRIKADPRARDEQGRATAFLRVHLWLIGTGLAIAVVSAIAFIVALLAH